MEFYQEQQRRTELVISQAKRGNFTEQEKEFYDDFFAEAGIKKNLSKMTEQDADDLLQALSASECSLEFVANVVNRVAIEAPPYVVEHILYSDLDEDGVPLIDELRLGRDPFHYESPSKKQQNQSVIAKKPDIEL